MLVGWGVVDLINEYGPAFGGALAVIGVMAGVVVFLDRRIKSLYDDIIKRQDATIQGLRDEIRDNNIQHEKELANKDALIEWWQRLTLRITHVSEGIVDDLERTSRRVS